MTIFHREPALILAFFASVVALGSNFLVHWTITEQALVNGVAVALVGLVTAWSVARDKLAAAISGLAAAVVELAIGFGAHISATDQAVILSFVATAVAMFIRTQVVARVAPPEVAA